MTGELSQRDRIAALPEAKRKAFADSLSQGEAEELLYNWGGFLAITASPQGLVGYLDGPGWPWVWQNPHRGRVGPSKGQRRNAAAIASCRIERRQIKGQKLSADAVHHTPASVLTVAGLA